MAKMALFAGLIIDEDEQPIEVAMVGGEAFYVVEDDGFRRHVESEEVDRQVLDHLRQMIEGHEDMIAEGTMKMIGQEDVFTKAMIETSLKDMDAQFDQVLEQGLPEEARAWMGMLGFQVVINLHGEVVRVEQPGMADESFD